ncbi:MAG: TetR/AcrR family transcriptional regulator [Agathobacter sp.]|nr:TetR/AcrR family transcriptional regulator [Agathobacter sp.]
MDNKERILEATMKVFNKKGLKFTMDDIAEELSMSKKTIYTVFDNKEAMFFCMVDYCFDKIKEQKNKVLSDDTLTTVEKLRGVLKVLPECYRDIDLSNLYQLKDKYPATYLKVEEQLESGWEGVIRLMEQGMCENVIRPINPHIVKTMMEATIEQFFQRDVLVINGISYNEALEEVVDILVDGILVND